MSLNVRFKKKNKKKYKNYIYKNFEKMLKTSSVKMLLMVLVGSIISYSEVISRLKNKPNFYFLIIFIYFKIKLIPLYFPPSYWSCTAAQILQLEGFLLAYGALVLKTWRFVI